MAKIGSPIKRPTSNGGFCGDQEAAPQLVINRERVNKSGPLAASVPAKFMELRPSMCRWPIGDPKHQCAEDTPRCFHRGCAAAGSAIRGRSVGVALTLIAMFPSAGVPRGASAPAFER